MILKEEYFIRGYETMLKEEKLPFSYDQLKKINFTDEECYIQFLEAITEEYWHFLDEEALEYGEGIDKSDLETVLFLYSFIEFLKEKNKKSS